MFTTNDWKESATLILLSPKASSPLLSNETPNCDYEVLSLVRPPKSIYESPSCVFPDGLLDSSDFSSKWWEVFELSGITPKETSVWSGIKKPRPSIIKDNITLEELRRSSNEEDDFVPVEIALRICAIRSTFIASGILLISGNKKNSSSYKPLLEDDLIEWRDRVIKTPATFIDFCFQFSMCPDLWSLYEWWNWLTPSSVGRNARCDTVMYVCMIDGQLGDGQWNEPVSLIQANIKSQLRLLPTQLYELTRISNFNSLDSLKEFAIQREEHGIERWLPVLATYDDGTLSLLPGDQFYPQEVDFLAHKPIRCYSKTLDEIRNKSVRINRMELRAPCIDVVCNIELTHGHKTPITTRNDLSINSHSKL